MSHGSAAPAGFFNGEDDREGLMSEMETKPEAMVEDFTDDLSDEALDRQRGEGRASVAATICDGAITDG
jgi:hypothetical protein